MTGTTTPSRAQDLRPTETSAIGLLKILLACSVVLPLVLFAIASWLNYQSAFSDAREELQRSSEVAREHAAKVFDGQSQVTDRVNDLVRGMNVETIQRSEQSLHDDFASIVARLPQVQSVLLVDDRGDPLVSASVYPVPQVSVADRDYFQAVVMNGYGGTYVSSLQSGAVNRQNFFGLARPWVGADGKTLGVIDVAVLPSFFEDFYKVLLGEGGDDPTGKVMTLIRDDGQILVRYPPAPGAPSHMPPASHFLAAIHAHPDEGGYIGNSLFDAGAPARVFAYRKVQGYPVYVVAGRTRSDIMADWQATITSHLIFGLPATVALFAVAWTALVRTRREEEALARARREITRREDAESALLRSQRLEAVGQMTGGVAHDFNNLLTVILGSAEILSKRADDPVRVRRIANQIALAAKRGGEVTQQLLAFSRRQIVKPETVDINRCLQVFKPLLDRAAQEAIAVELDLQLGLHPVRLDPGHFEAAVLNLVGNARDAMPQGGRIMISTRNARLGLTPAATELPPGHYVRVAVTDNGSGMDTETAAKAFEPFFTTKEIGRGTGLGLSQVYGFAKQAGGDVHISSTLGKGTTIEILLPMEEESASDTTGQALTQAQRAASGEVVLVVEDEPEVLEMAVECLRDLGYGTLQATTGQAALKQLQTAGRIDVLFSDVVMPGGMDGFQLRAEARRLRPGLKVLLTSGYPGSFERTNESDLRLLTKPYDRVQLANHVSAVLQG